MAVDVCSEISSPRISFSHDLKELDLIPIDNLLNNPTIDFDFDISQNTPQQISSADELFADGKILPVQIKKPITRKKPEPHKKRLIEFLSTTCDEFDKPSPKPFWQFRKSNSVNYETSRSTNNGNGLLRSLHFLTRSKSTGSALNPKQTSSFGKAMLQKQNSLQETSIRRESSCGSQYYPYNNVATKKPFLKKSTSGSFGNAVKINPVLNIPPVYIAKGTVSLFGLGSFFGSKKSKKKRK